MFGKKTDKKSKMHINTAMKHKMMFIEVLLQLQKLLLMLDWACEIISRKRSSTNYTKQDIVYKSIVQLN